MERADKLGKEIDNENNEDIESYFGWPDNLVEKIDKENIESYLRDAERASGIMGGYIISHCLENMLKIIMINDPIVDELFDSPRSLGTLAAKIECAYAFGLIDKQTKADLNYIRKIRNKFAHTFENLSFDDSPIRDWCQELSAVKNKEIETDNSHEAFSHTLDKTMKLFLLQLQKRKKKSPNAKPSE